MSVVLAPPAGPAAHSAPSSPPGLTRAANDDRRRAAPLLRVGLVRTEGSWPWRDDPRLASLIEAVRDVAFHSLRHDELARPAGTTSAAPPDLVITLDLATARLALALGCPVWLLAPCDHGRRPVSRHDGIRVFSPQRPFDWRAPLARMAAELGAMALPHMPKRVEDFRPGPDWFPAAI